MDMVAACRVLLEVDERGSVTRAAAALRIAQSVASRRILALEKHFGSPLLERNARAAVLTPFGRDVLGAARRLVLLADELELDVERARLRPVTIGVPEDCTTRDLAVADAAAREAGLRIEFVAAPPQRRAQLISTLSVRVAALAVPSDQALWLAELGAAGRRPSVRPLRLESLRPSRHIRAPRDGIAGSSIHIGPEDDLPHIRDVLTRAAFAGGLIPGQIQVDTSTTSALAAVLAEGDLLLCTEAEALDLGLHWRPFTGLDVNRGFTLAGDSAHDVRAVRENLEDEIAGALGAKVVSRDPETADA